MIQIAKQTFFGDFLKNFEKNRGQDLETSDPELIQLQY